MKPISIRFKCFGPYMDEQYIDFQQLEKCGLFLICGETGSGKTTILDAMCYALYGKSSGGSRGDLAAMRCKQADKNDETLVEFIFEEQGLRYQFVRSLRYGSKNLNDYHNCMILRDGNYIPFLANPTLRSVNQKAQELIGLTYDQFRQVIILPQGKFETLLVSDSAAKEEILVSLFHADRWRKITDEICRRAAAEDDRLCRDRQQIFGKLQEYGMDTVEALADAARQHAMALGELRQRVLALENQSAAAKGAYQTALLTSESFQELSRRQKKLAGCQRRREAMEQERALLALADQAENIEPLYRALRDARERAADSRTAFETAAKKTKLAQSACATAMERLKVHRQAGAETEEKEKLLILLEGARELYGSLAQKRSDAENAHRRTAEALRLAGLADQALQVRHQAWLDALECQRQSMEEYRRAQDQYLSGISGVLAQSLKEGSPCPVCGNLHHPSPAALSGTHITEEALNRYNDALTNAGHSVANAADARAAAESQKKAADAALQQARQDQTAADTAYEALLERKIAGIETSAQLESRISRLDEEIRRYAADEERWVEAVYQAQNQHAAAQAMEETLRQDLEAQAEKLADAEETWRQGLAASGLDTEARFTAVSLTPAEKNRRKTGLIRFEAELSSAEAALKEQEQALAGQTPPDMDGLKKAMEQADQSLKEQTRQLILEQQLAERMEKDAHSLSLRLEKNNQERIAVDSNLEFAARLRGSSGVSLQRYVLGVMLTAITVEANRLLEHVHGGRYRLYRSDESSGSTKRSGLELEVLDNHNNQRRSVTTLSGGEKFLVSLSLAIGLSTVVQAQGNGARMEAMFIDEGFGSLDDHSITDALEVLQGIQRSNGLVGIISHVDKLAETIPAKIQVVAGSNGSRCIIQTPM